MSQFLNTREHIKRILTLSCEAKGLVLGGLPVTVFRMEIWYLCWFYKLFLPLKRKNKFSRLFLLHFQTFSCLILTFLSSLIIWQCPLQRPVFSPFPPWLSPPSPTSIPLLVLLPLWPPIHLNLSTARLLQPVTNAISISSIKLFLFSSQVSLFCPLTPLRFLFILLVGAHFLHSSLPTRP